ETAPEVHVRHALPGIAQRREQRAELLERELERAQLGKLAANMDCESAHLEARHRGEARVDFGRAADRNTELVVGLAGRDLVVGAGVDVRVDAQRAARPLTPSLGDRRKLRAFFLRLDVELADPGIEPLHQLTRSLADAREYDVVGGHSGCQCARQLTARDDVRTEALALHHAEYRE